MLNEAVQCLQRIRKEEDGKEDADLGVPKASDPHSSQSNDQVMSDDERSDDLKEQKESHSTPEGAASAAPDASGSRCYRWQ